MWLRKIWEGCRKEGITYPVVAIVHDEIVANVPKTELKKYKKIKDGAFHATAAKLYKGIPFEAETEQGKSWGCKQFSDQITEDEDGEE
jgi:DNA polymerase I-like protein with 3'-5' exonuclease and polymerase domains